MIGSPFSALTARVLTCATALSLLPSAASAVEVQFGPAIGVPGGQTQVVAYVDPQGADLSHTAFLLWPGPTLTLALTETGAPICRSFCADRYQPGSGQGGARPNCNNVSLRAEACRSRPNCVGVSYSELFIDGPPPAGGALFTCTVNIAPDAALGEEHYLACPQISASAGLTILPATCADTAVVEVACPGDCDLDGAVTVDELVTGITILLGEAPVSACPILDRNASGAVRIAELVQGRNSLVLGCGQ